MPIFCWADADRMEALSSLRFRFVTVGESGTRCGMMESWTAMVTGASSGLGEAFARALAPRVRRLVLVARRDDRLVRVRAEMMAAHATLEEVRVCRVDLGDAGERDRLAASECGEIDLLVNNAGLGDCGDFAGSSWARNESMIEVNMTAVTRLTHAVLPDPNGARLVRKTLTFNDLYVAFISGLR